MSAGCFLDIRLRYKIRTVVFMLRTEAIIPPPEDFLHSLMVGFNLREAARNDTMQVLKEVPVTADFL